MKFNELYEAIQSSQPKVLEEALQSKILQKIIKFTDDKSLNRAYSYASSKNKTISFLQSMRKYRENGGVNLTVVDWANITDADFDKFTPSEARKKAAAGHLLFWISTKAKANPKYATHSSVYTSTIPKNILVGVSHGTKLLNFNKAGLSGAAYQTMGQGADVGIWNSKNVADVSDEVYGISLETIGDRSLGALDKRADRKERSKKTIFDMTTDEQRKANHAKYRKILKDRNVGLDVRKAAEEALDLTSELAKRIYRHILTLEVSPHAERLSKTITVMGWQKYNWGDLADVATRGMSDIMGDVSRILEDTRDMKKAIDAIGTDAILFTADNKNSEHDKNSYNMKAEARMKATREWADDTINAKKLEIKEALDSLKRFNKFLDKEIGK